MYNKSSKNIRHHTTFIRVLLHRAPMFICRGATSNSTKWFRALKPWQACRRVLSLYCILCIFQYEKLCVDLYEL